MWKFWENVLCAVLLCAGRCWYVRVKIAPRPWGLASANPSRVLSGKVSPAHVFIHLIPAKQRRWPGLLAPTEPTSAKAKKAIKKDEQSRARSLKVTQSRQTLDFSSAKRRKGHRLFSAYLSSLIGGPHPAALLSTIHSTPLCRLIRSSTSDPPWISQTHLMPESQRPPMWKNTFHPYFMRDWNKLREWIIRWCSFDYTGRFDWVIPARADGSGDIIVIVMGFDLTFRTLLYLPHFLVVSLGMADSALLIIILTILQQITSLHHPASLLESWQWSHGLDHESMTVKK